MMGQLSVSLLGSFAVEIGDQPLIHFRTKAVQALFIYLVCQPEKHAREALMTLLWPELPLKSAQANLRHAFYHLKQVVPNVDDPGGTAVPFLLADRQTIQVNPDGRFLLDMAQFESLTAAPDPGSWESAVALYRGEFLSDFFLPDSPDFESWAQTRRTDLRGRYLKTLSRLADRALEEGRLEQAENYARRQLAVDNLQEEAHRQLMCVLAQSGRRTAALAHYQDLRQLLQEELAVGPSTATETLVELIRRDQLPEHTRAAVGEEAQISPRRAAHNLPVQATPFIGRLTELAAMDDLLAADHMRLVTILGAGGMGKTRLALAAAQRQLDQKRFAQGIFFVPLADLTERDHVVTAIAGAMNIRLERGDAQLLNYLQEKQILLILDNCEQVIEGADLLSSLLQKGPNLKILATSRERLRLHNEQVFPLQGLAVEETAGMDDARALFLQAARRQRPDFQAAGQNLADLNLISRLVDGMPLALELAAAWVDMLSPAEIAAEIQRSLDFLASDLRDLPARHRSMQAVFAASWVRLTEKEQRLLAQATVFRVDFSLAAVTAVTGASLRDLATLVSKSLLTYDAHSGRYHIHKLLKQFAAARLGEKTVLQDRHSAYYLDWLTGQYDRLTGAEQMAAVLDIQTEMPNIRAAFFHAVQNEHFSILEPLISVLDEYFEVSGQIQDGLNLYRKILESLRVQDHPDPFVEFWLLILTAKFYGHLFLDQQAAAYFMEAQELLKLPYFDQKETRAEQAMLLHEEGYKFFASEPEHAVQLFRQSQELLESLGNPIWLVRGLLGVARAQTHLGDLRAAHTFARRAFSLAQSLGNPMLQTESSLLMGRITFDLGDHVAAEKELQEALVSLREFYNPQMHSLGLTYLGYGQMLNGRFTVALQTSKECQRVCKDYSLYVIYNQMLLLEANCLLHLGDYDCSFAANQASRRALDTVSEIFDRFGENHLTSARLALVQGNMIQARAHLGFEENFTIHFRMNRQLLLGIINAVEGQTAEAKQTIREVLLWHAQRENAAFLAETLAATACYFALEGAAEKAVQLYALAGQHPFVANSQFMADIIGQRVAAVGQSLSPASLAQAENRGKALDLWATAESLLANEFKLSR